MPGGLSVFVLFASVSAAGTCWVWMDHVQGVNIWRNRLPFSDHPERQLECLLTFPNSPQGTPVRHHRRWQRTHKHTYTPTVGALPSCARTHVIDGPWSFWLVDELFYSSLSGEREELEEGMELEFTYCSRKQEELWSRHEESWVRAE